MTFKIDASRSFGSSEYVLLRNRLDGNFESFLDANLSEDTREVASLQPVEVTPDGNTGAKIVAQAAQTVPSAPCGSLVFLSSSFGKPLLRERLLASTRLTQDRGVRATDSRMHLNMAFELERRAHLNVNQQAELNSRIPGVTLVLPIAAMALSKGPVARY